MRAQFGPVNCHTLAGLLRDWLLNDQLELGCAIFGSSWIRYKYKKDLFYAKYTTECRTPLHVQCQILYNAIYFIIPYPIQCHTVQCHILHVQRHTTTPVSLATTVLPWVSDPKMLEAASSLCQQLISSRGGSAASGDLRALRVGERPHPKWSSPARLKPRRF